MGEGSEGIGFGIWMKRDGGGLDRERSRFGGCGLGQWWKGVV